MLHELAIHRYLTALVSSGSGSDKSTADGGCGVLSSYHAPLLRSFVSESLCRASLLFPLLPLGSLSAHIHFLARHRTPLSWDALRYYGAALACQLEALHARGIIHADVKPDNVLFDARGRPVLVDLGQAVVVTASPLPQTAPQAASRDSVGRAAVEANTSAANAAAVAGVDATATPVAQPEMCVDSAVFERLKYANKCNDDELTSRSCGGSAATDSDSVLALFPCASFGTVPFMSPCRHLGHRFGFEEDVWGLAVTLFAAAAGGTLPFQGGSHEETRRRLCDYHEPRPAPKPAAPRRLEEESADANSDHEKESGGSASESEPDADGESELAWPLWRRMDPLFRSLMEQCLNRSRAPRLRDLTAFCTHPFFASVDWAAVRSGSAALAPPCNRTLGVWEYDERFGSDQSAPDAQQPKSAQQRTLDTHALSALSTNATAPFAAPAARSSSGGNSTDPFAAW
jgi:serine/threonine protein kinase